MGNCPSFPRRDRVLPGKFGASEQSQPQRWEDDSVVKALVLQA